MQFSEDASKKHLKGRLAGSRRVKGVSILNLALPVFSLLFLAATILYWNTASFGLSVYVDGDKVATVEDETVYGEANKRISEMVTYEAAAASDYYRTPSYEITLTDSLSSVDSVMESLLSQYEGELTEAVGLYIDGQLSVVVEDEEELTSALDTYKLNAGTVSGSEKEFVQDVRVVPGLYADGSVVSPNMLRQMLSGGVLGLDVSETVTDTHVEEIAYKTEYTKDSSLYEDESVVTREGVNGSVSCVDRVTLVNGKETSREEISRDVLKEAVSEQVKVGTKERPAPSGSFCWPTPSLNMIMTYFEERWGSFHGALDISGPSAEGSDILASDSGTVVWSGDCDDGYGNYIIIDHGNGFQTWYAHCSALFVSEGDQVTKGEVIGLVGNTGDSYGAHLHFEIRLNGEKVDPLQYTSY